MKYGKTRKNPSQLQNLTGFSVEEFDSFLPAFRYEWDKYCSHYTLQGKVRERISCGCGNGLLPMIGDKLPFLLSCLKNSPLQECNRQNADRKTKRERPVRKTETGKSYSQGVFQMS
ncbi:MAG: hypothetical protein LBQ70_06000 [Prevotellaceae bacterium]|jgi:hypothetical protein|nr:hypothetical protein [Prevotellaceae bacterium]